MVWEILLRFSTNSMLEIGTSFSHNFNGDHSCAYNVLYNKYCLFQDATLWKEGLQKSVQVTFHWQINEGGFNSLSKTIPSSRFISAPFLLKCNMRRRPYDMVSLSKVKHNNGYLFLIVLKTDTESLWCDSRPPAIGGRKEPVRSGTSGRVYGRAIDLLSFFLPSAVFS